MDDYKPFRKTVLGKNGKPVKRWYYYYTDSFGKQYQKVCKHCTSQAAAWHFVDNLPKQTKANWTINSITHYMFVPGSEHMKRREQTGKKIVESTLLSDRHYIRLIQDRFGQYDIRNITAKDIIDSLLDVPRSGSWKNGVLYVWHEIYREANWRGCRVTLPELQSFARNSVKADIFTTDELSRFFRPENWQSKDIYMMFLLALSAGLRLSEARGFRACQFYPDMNIILVDGFLNEKGTRLNYNKKGSETNLKWRTVVLPNITANKLKSFIKYKNVAPESLLFDFEGRQIRMTYARTVFNRALLKAGIETEGRKLCPHSLRYTYVTRMRRFLPEDIVQKMAGHTSCKMTEYYTRSGIDDMTQSIMPYKDAADRLFD